MSTSAPLQSIATSLDTYRTQFAALGNALTALRVVSDQLIAQLDRDREALETHLQADIALKAAARAEAEAAVLACTTAEETTAAEEVPTATELREELACDCVAEVALHTAESIEAPAAELDTGSLSEATTQIENMEAEIALEASTLDAAAPASEAAEPTATAPSADVASEVSGASAVADDGNVISLADRRRSHSGRSPARRRATAFVASILVTAGATLGLHEILHSDLGQRILELGTCDGDMLSATRDCSLLAWLTI